MKGKWLALAAVAVLVAAAGVFLKVGTRSRSVPAPAAGIPARAAVDRNVITLPGRIEARHILSVACPVDGILEQVFAEVGQEVSEGQLLARIRSGKLESAREAAEAESEQAQTKVTDLQGQIIEARLEQARAADDLERARLEYERATRAHERQQLLYRAGATPRLVFEKSGREYQAASDDYESRQAIVRSAQARIDSLNRQLDASRRDQADKQQSLEEATGSAAAEELHSPSNGVVIARKGDPGAQVTVAVSDFFQLATDLEQLQITMDVPRRALERIKAGLPAEVRVAEAPDALAGTVREVKGGQAIVEFVSPSPAVRPGLTALVRIKLT